MREVDPTPRTSHVTPPFGNLSTLAAAMGRWGLARYSALHNAPGYVCDARPGHGTKPCFPPRQDTGGTATYPGGAPPPLPSLPLKSLGVRAGSRPSLSQVGDQLPAFPLSFLERGLQWFSGPPGFWYRVCATRSESVCTPVAPPLEPSLCSQLPTPLWWRSRSPALPHRPPPPTTALACIVRVVLCVCQRLPRVWHGCVRCVRCEWV